MGGFLIAKDCVICRLPPKEGFDSIPVGVRSNPELFSIIIRQGGVDVNYEPLTPSPRDHCGAKYYSMV